MLKNDVIAPFIQYENAQEIGPPAKNLRPMQPSLFLAKKVGARLGTSTILLRAMPKDLQGREAIRIKAYETVKINPR